jgi:hypothetical protein
MRRQRVPPGTVAMAIRIRHAARRHPHTGCPPAQPERDRPRHPSAASDRAHGTVGLGQELARARHALRRGPAPLHRVALDLREAVPGADAEARGRLARRTLARGRDRAEEPDEDEPLDRRDGDRGLRLHAASVVARGPHALPGVWPPRPTRHGELGRGPGARAAERHPLPGYVSAAAERPGDARAGGVQPASDGLRARARRR